MKKIIITIDGPAASGKGRIAKAISKRWNLKHLDSGTLYRRIAHNILENNIDIKYEKNLEELTKNDRILSFRKDKKLRSENISKIASKIAVFQSIRKYVNKYQREFVSKNSNYKGFVVDGRDIGSVVFKNAKLKLYIDSNEKNRAKRRYKQLIDTGEKSIYPEILKELKLRDKKDKNRKNSPLVIPKNSVIVDNNGSFTSTINTINKIIKKII